jgi:hypothetical protein
MFLSSSSLFLFRLVFLVTPHFVVSPKLRHVKLSSINQKRIIHILK